MWAVWLMWTPSSLKLSDGGFLIDAAYSCCTGHYHIYRMNICAEKLNDSHLHCKTDEWTAAFLLLQWTHDMFASSTDYTQSWSMGLFSIRQFCTCSVLLYHSHIKGMIITISGIKNLYVLMKVVWQFPATTGVFSSGSILVRVVFCVF